MKLKKISILTLAAIMLFTTGVFAGSNVTKITAYLNKSLTLKIDGSVVKPTENDGSRLYPIVYNGRTYLPAKVVAEALGATVDYDGSGSGTVIITSGSDDEDMGKPTKDGSSNNSGSSSSNGNVKSASYDEDKMSTWLKATEVSFSNLPDAKSSSYKLLKVTFKNVSSETVDFSSYGDLSIEDESGEDFSSVIGIGLEYPTSGKIEPGETKTFYKGFVADSISDVDHIYYYPLIAKTGDKTIIYQK
jgi:hypothetical protein